MWPKGVAVNRRWSTEALNMRRCGTWRGDGRGRRRPPCRGSEPPCKIPTCINGGISSISTRHGDSQESVAWAAAPSAGGGRRRQGGGVARIAFSAATVSGSARTSTARFAPEPTLRHDRRPFWTQA